jgi:uncharacterized BrkB/YihY/UPF0761 family membrane protein
MPRIYWVMVWFAVLCMLAAPIGYRRLHASRERIGPRRWRLAARLCGLLFCLGLLLLIALGLLYPKQAPLLPDFGRFAGPWRNV